MTFEELISRVAAQTIRPEATPAVVRSMLQAYSRVVSAALRTGEEVPMPDVGRLRVKHRPARNGRHPRTGEPLAIPARDVAEFVASPKFTAAMNGGVSRETPSAEAAE